MNALTKAWLLGHMLKWRLTWNRRDTQLPLHGPGNASSCRPATPHG